MGFPPSHECALSCQDVQNFGIQRMCPTVLLSPNNPHPARFAPRIREILGIRWIVGVGDVAQDRQDFGTWHLGVSLLKERKRHTTPRVTPHPVVFEQIVSEFLGGWFPVITHGFPPYAKVTRRCHRVVCFR